MVTKDGDGKTKEKLCISKKIGVVGIEIEEGFLKVIEDGDEDFTVLPKSIPLREFTFNRFLQKEIIAHPIT